MSVYKMNKHETMKFIQLYRDKRCLWYPYHENYKNQDERCDAAASIACKMNMDGFGPIEVIRKFKNLRSSYCQELKKIKKSADGSYKPKVSWFKLMDSFIRPYVHQKPATAQDVAEEYREDTEYSTSFNESSLRASESAKVRDKYRKYNIHYYNNEFQGTYGADPCYSVPHVFTQSDYGNDNPEFAYRADYGIEETRKDFNHLTREILKNKWRNLRDTYGKHLKSISPIAGPNVKKSYKHWQWANHMDYFRPYLSYAYVNASQDYDTVDYESEQNSNTAVNTFSELTEVTPKIETHSSQHISGYLQSVSSVIEQEIDFLPINYKSKPIKEERRNNRLSDYLPPTARTSQNFHSHHEQSMQKYSDTSKKCSDLDATELIFLGYARTVKTLSSRRQACLKMKLAQIMTEEEEDDEYYGGAEDDYYDDDVQHLHELALSTMSVPSSSDYIMPGGGSGSPSSPSSVQIPPKKHSSLGASSSSMPCTLQSSTPAAVPPPPPPEVCLRWNSYHSNMQATFPTLLNNEQFVDVTLACEGRSIKCHKVMLSACSSYFEELLSQNPCQHPIVFMRDLKFWEVQALVEFMYSGEVNVAQEKLPSLLAAAEALQIKGLTGPSQTSNQDESDYVSTHESEEAPVTQTHKRVRKRKSTNPMAYLSRQAQHSPKQMPMMHPIGQHSTPQSTPTGAGGIGMSSQHSMSASPNRKDTTSSSSYHPPIKIKKERESTPPLALIKEEPLDLGKDSMETGSNNGQDLSNSSSYQASNYDRSQYSGRNSSKPQNGLSDEEDQSSTHSNQSDDPKSPMEHKPDPGDDGSDD